MIQSYNAQFNELLETLELQRNQPFEFTIHTKYENQADYEEKKICGYFPEDRNDVIYDIYTNQELNLSKGIREEIIFNGNPSTQPGEAYRIDANIFPQNPEENFDNGQVLKIKINDEIINTEVTIKIVTRDDFMTGGTIEDKEIVFLDNDNYRFYYGYNEYERMDGYYIQIKNSTDSSITSMQIQIYEDKEVKIIVQEGDNDDIRRKIYTGEIQINTAPYEKLTGDEKNLIKLLIEKGYTYLCGTPTKELYVFKANDIANLRIGTIILNGGNQIKGWYHPNYFGSTTSYIQSLGHKINSTFKPLQSNSQFLYLKLPQNDGVLDEQEFDKMSKGFITIGSKEI